MRPLFSNSAYFHRIVRTKRFNSRDACKAAGDSVKMDTAMGLSIGYVSLPVQQLGWTSNLSFIQAKKEQLSLNYIRLDGNLAYALNEKFYFKGGLNGTKIIGKEGESLKTGYDLQVGVGYQVDSTIFELGYSSTHFLTELPGFGMTVSALELGVSATF
ncbi:porin family protein [Bdellovibrio reynosensis]|uniref:Porin family protein n=1 Tax=Bdellovibrio reynosensis TaxID=2835041 RepID=A0ABY4C6T3_9BACT|nr:porin family protein [Bdellovibrio reynosensis]UOF00615.1 porin family protein [Bdellovibrio reynosensis]